MDSKPFFAAAILLAAASPASAGKPDAGREQGAPPASATARYCLRIEAVTGTRVERVLCLTRAEWFDQDVDVDREWSRDGVRVLS